MHILQLYKMNPLHIKVAYMYVTFSETLENISYVYISTEVLNVTLICIFYRMSTKLGLPGPRPSLNG